VLFAKAVLFVLFAIALEALHSSLSGEAPDAEDLSQWPVSNPVRVLFLCTHNSARSQMDEGLPHARSDGLVDAFSAGTEVRPLAIRAMAQMNIGISHQHSKHLYQFREQHFDYIITVCDRARESCPEFPGDPVQIHGIFPDPATVVGTEDERFTAFMQTAV
jgi:arsenate reductase